MWFPAVPILERTTAVARVVLNIFTVVSLGLQLLRLSSYLLDD